MRAPFSASSPHQGNGWAWRRLIVPALAVALFVGCESDTVPSQAAEAAATPPADGAAANGAYSERLLDAAVRGDLAAVARRIEAGDDVSAADADGRTALMYAAFDGHTPVVAALLDAGAPVDTRDPLGRTALHYAATGPFPETVELLLERGADPHVADTGERFTPLMHAAAEGHAAVVQVLLTYGADPNRVDADGDKALAFARQNGHSAVVGVLEAVTSE